MEHNRRSIDQGISSVLLKRCAQSPQDHLQGQPACSCGFQLGESTQIRPLREIERALDLGIKETIEAFKAPAMQEKIVPFIEGLDLVGKKKEADAIRQFLDLSARDEAFLDQLEKCLTPQVIRNINEAFRGKVVIVKRDLDNLYQKLIHRKYTLAQTRKIIEDWLTEETISGDTFLHFLGKEDTGTSDRTKEVFSAFLEGQFNHLVSLYLEIGHDQLVRVLITTYWANQYDIPIQKILEIFPFLERGAQTENERWIVHLIELAQSLRSQKPRLFESLVSEVEESASFIKELWSALPSFSPAEVFEKESVFSLVLKEAFERVMCEKPEKADLKGLMDSGYPQLGENSLFREQRDEMVNALKNYHLLKEKISALKSIENSGPKAYLRWESHFIKNISPIPALISSIHGQLDRIGTRVPPFFKKEEKEVLHKLNSIKDDFREFYQAALPLWEKAEGPRPMMIQDIPLMLSKKRGVPDHKLVFYVLMDCVSWELWEHIKLHFFGKWPNLFRVVREGTLWANQPTDTATQLSYFEQAFRLTYPDMDQKDLLLKASGIDEKIHTEKGPLTHLFASVISYLEIELLFRLKKLPSRSLLILFSDHGFVENPAFNPTDKYESPRYLHGKDSPFEVIIPWAWVMRL